MKNYTLFKWSLKAIFVFNLLSFSATFSQADENRTETFVYVGNTKTVHIRDSERRIKSAIEVTPGLEVTAKQLISLIRYNQDLRNSFISTKTQIDNTVGFYGATGIYRFKDEAGKVWTRSLRAGDRIPPLEARAILGQNLSLSYFDFDFSPQKADPRLEVKRRLRNWEVEILHSEEEAQALRERTARIEANRNLEHAKFIRVQQRVQEHLRSEIETADKELMLRAAVSNPYRQGLDYEYLQSEFVQNKLRDAMKIYPIQLFSEPPQVVLRQWQSDPNMAATIIEWYDAEMESRRLQNTLTPEGLALMNKIKAGSRGGSCLKLFR